MTTAAVEQYTGEGEPPYCEMTLRAAMSDGSTPPDLTLPVTLTGVKQPTTITLEREAQKSLVDDIFGLSEQETGKQFAISNNSLLRYKIVILVVMAVISPANVCGEYANIRHIHQNRTTRQ